MSESFHNPMMVSVGGQPYPHLPKDLYIPPDALRVLLTTFEGPLDLLLYLIRKDNIDILDIPITSIIEQYLEYMQLMEQLDIALAAEYLLMAAILGEIKAKLLFPQSATLLDGEHHEDPRFELMEQLQAYARLKHAAQYLAQMPYVGEHIHLSALTVRLPEVAHTPPPADAKRLQQCLDALGKQQSFRKAHTVTEDPLVLSQCLLHMREQLNRQSGWQNLEYFYEEHQGNAGIVLNLMAMLELDREQVLEWYQEEHFSPVFLKKREKLS